MKAHLFIFDFDGTVSYTGDDIAFSVNDVRAKHGLAPLPVREVLKNVGYGARVLIANTVSVPGFSTDEILGEYKESYLRHCLDTSVPYDGFIETIDALISRGNVVSMFTNKPLPVTLKMLDRFGITNKFRSVYCPENLNNRKPDPEGIFRCMEDAGIANEFTVMVGDSKADIDAGKAANVKTCACLYGMGDKKTLLAARPDRSIENITELVKMTE